MIIFLFLNHEAPNFFYNADVYTKKASIECLKSTENDI